MRRKPNILKLVIGKNYIPGLVFLLSIFSGCSHSLNVKRHLEMDQGKILQLENMLAPLRNSQSRYSLNVHTQVGVNQIRINEIDSLTLMDDNFCLYEKSGLFKYNLNQVDSISFSSIYLPNRPSGAISGSNFLGSVETLNFKDREAMIKEEILKGNFPDLFRNMCRIKTFQPDSLGVIHEVVLEVMPDYLAIGSNEDYSRIPMGPQTAQAIADAFKCSLPTRKIVNIIYSNTSVKIDPVTYYPVGNTNELASTFYRHNKDIQARFISEGGKAKCLIGGLKKDVIITNQLALKPNKVAIYGWHKPDGKPIQPLYTGHVNWYVDYSHGVRLINSVLRVDGQETTIQKLLSDPVLYKLISDESGIMLQPFYKY